MTPLKPVTKKITASTEQLDELYDIPIGTWSSWRSKGVGPKYSKFGKQVVYLLTDVENFLQVHKLKRIRSRAGRILAFKQNGLPGTETVEATAPDGSKEVFRTLPLDGPQEDIRNKPETSDLDFVKMIQIQIQATRTAAELIAYSKNGKAFASQTIATLETLGAWIAQIERKISK